MLRRPQQRTSSSQDSGPIVSQLPPGYCNSPRTLRSFKKLCLMPAHAHRGVQHSCNGRGLTASPLTRGLPQPTRHLLTLQHRRKFLIFQSQDQGAPKGRQQKGETGPGTHIFADFCRFSLIFGSVCKSRDLGVTDCAENRRKPQIFAGNRRKPQIFAETGFSHLLSPFWRAPTRHGEINSEVGRIFWNKLCKYTNDKWLAFLSEPI